MRSRYFWIVGVIAAVLLAGAAFLALRGAPGGQSVALPPAQPDSSSPAGGGGVTGVTEAPKVVDIPTPPNGLAAKVAASGVSGLTAEERAAWEKYLAETSAVVRTNAKALRARTDEALAAITVGDSAALSAMFAPDENPSADFVAERVRAYPRIQEYESQSSVGVFAVSQATVYYGYSVVRWEDGGIESEHTVTVPMRFVGGTWYLTTIGSGTQDISTVQTVIME